VKQDPTEVSWNAFDFRHGRNLLHSWRGGCQFLQDGNLVFVAGLARLKQGGLCLDGQHEIDDILLLVRRQAHLGL
jgi:hypothetical protein